MEKPESSKIRVVSKVLSFGGSSAGERGFAKTKFSRSVPKNQRASGKFLSGDRNFARRRIVTAVVHDCAVFID